MRLLSVFSSILTKPFSDRFLSKGYIDPAVPLHKPLGLLVIFL